MGVCYQPAIQDDNIDELFYKESTDFSTSSAFVLMGDFNFPHISWKYHAAYINRCRKFLKHIENNFLVQVLSELARKDTFLDLLFVNREGHFGEVVLGVSNHWPQKKNHHENFNPRYGDSRLWTAAGAS